MYPGRWENEDKAIFTLQSCFFPGSLLLSVSIHSSLCLNIPVSAQCGPGSQNATYWINESKNAVAAPESSQGPAAAGQQSGA